MAARRAGQPEGRGGSHGLLPAGSVLVPLILLMITVAGCTSEPNSGPASSGRGMTGTGDPGYYLYQNVVNVTVTGTGTPEETLRAAAIRDAIDSRDPVTRDFAAASIPRQHGGPFSIGQACDLWEAVDSRWIYVDDPLGKEYFSPASRTITLGFRGDCDDFAIVMAALIGSVGGSSRIVMAANSSSAHAYPEVYAGKTPAEFEAAASYIRTRYQITDIGCHITTGPGGPRYWINFDWGSRHPGGRFFTDEGRRIAYYPDGRWEQVGP